MTIHLEDVSTIQRQSYLQHAIGPRPVCFASTIDMEGNVNLSPFSFFNLFSITPPIVVFSPSRRSRDNTTKHTYENVLQVPEVVRVLQEEALEPGAFDLDLRLSIGGVFLLGVFHDDLLAARKEVSTRPIERAVVRNVFVPGCVPPCNSLSKPCNCEKAFLWRRTSRDARGLIATARCEHRFRRSSDTMRVCQSR